MDSFARYLDVDGDGICYRTLPGEHPKGAYLIRGSGHNKLGGYTENADEYVEVVDRLRRKFDTAAELVPEPVTETLNKSSCVIVMTITQLLLFKVSVTGSGTSSAAVSNLRRNRSTTSTYSSAFSV